MRERSRITDPEEAAKFHVPEAPRAYQALTWSRDAKISFFQVFKVPMWQMGIYLEMRDLEQEYGVQAEQQQDTM